jgi:hypothetical protein
MPITKAFQYDRERAGTMIPSRREPWRLVVVTMVETPGASNLLEARREGSEVV